MTGLFENVTVVDVVGMAGVLLYTSNYFFVAIGRASAHSVRFFLRNTVAAGCVLFSLTQDLNMFALIIQVFYVVFSLVGIAVHLRRTAEAA